LLNIYIHKNEDLKQEIEMTKLWSPICERLGIENPIFGFAHDVAAVAAITNAGGYGVYGATRRFPHEITQELAAIRKLVGDKPFGVDLVLPPGMPEHNSREAIEAEIPEEHKAFVEQLIEKFQVPAATEPGMRTRFIRSTEIEEEQIQAVLVLQPTSWKRQKREAKLPSHLLAAPTM
jgi:NAD(P)H-dependent flavin oxidoreductase YrpB (nitropropane dioxygenase family)